MISVDSWTPPTPEQLEEVAALLDGPRKRAHFFNRLENPKWVEPLRKLGFFDNPPVPFKDEENTTLFPIWPEGYYLTRMAESAPDAVVAVLEEAVPSENPTVTGHILRAAGALPDNHFRRISKKIPRWLQISEPEYYTFDAIDTVSRLLDTGQIDEGLAAAKVILEVRPDPRPHKQLEALIHARPHPMAKFPEYDYEYPELEYQNVIDDVSHIISRTGLKGLKILSSTLEDMLCMNDRNDERYKSGDYSYVWRPTLDCSSEVRYRGVEHVLISVVCETAERLSRQSEKDLESVICHLESSTLLHIRIALHILAFSEHGAYLIAERVTDRALFDDHRLRREYATLLRQRFGDVDANAQRKVLGWIASGPDIKNYIEYSTLWYGAPPSDTDKQRYADSWRRDWYGVVERHLDNADREIYLRLVSELGPPEEPDFPKLGYSGWTGPESPLTIEEMQARPPRSIVAYLRRWHPADDPDRLEMPSVDGLGLALEEVVPRRADDYAAISESFIGLHPAYLVGFFAGLDRGFRKSTFCWREPLKLADWVTSRPLRPAGDAETRGQSRGWQQCRHEIALLLNSGLTDPDHQIPFELRSSVWRLLARLATDPCPPPEREESDADPSDALTRCTDDSLARAMHAVIAYALWCRRHLESTEADVNRGFDLVPEARRILERHLDPSLTLSPVVHSVCGSWLPQLVILDKVWVAEHLDRIFPEAPESAALLDAAWTTYIRSCPAQDPAFGLLRAQYEAAIRRIGATAEPGRDRSNENDLRLGEHLVTMFWEGTDDGSLVREYFHRASDELASEVMEFVGAKLTYTEGADCQTAKERVQEVWDYVKRSDGDDHAFRDLIRAPEPAADG